MSIQRIGISDNSHRRERSGCEVCGAESTIGVRAAVGIGLAFAAARLLASVLAGFTSGRVMACYSAVAVVAFAGRLAGLAPALRASTLDAMTALRNE